MATITRALFSVVWISTYPSLLSSATGRLLTRDRYTAEFATLGAELTLPWTDETGRPAWNRFWSSYLGGPGKLRTIGADAAWDHLVPFKLVNRLALQGPGGTAGEGFVLVYPASVAVVDRVEVSTASDVSELASYLADIRTSTNWQSGANGSTRGNRSLDGIASDVRESAFAFLSNEPHEVGAETVLSVTAPLAGTGKVGELALTDPNVKACLPGLAVLGPPGSYDERRLLEANSDPRRTARIYALRGGHAIWHPEHILSPPANDAVSCLQHNHTSLVVHITALGDLVSWASEEIGAGGEIPASIQPLIKRAVLRLEQLKAGDQRKTYRAGVATTRIERITPAMAAVTAALGSS